MEFREFAERTAEIEATEADLRIVSLVADLLAEAEDDLPVVARFVQGRVFPAWSSRTLDIGPSLCYAALARAAGPNVSAEDVEDRLAERGDVGEVAASLDLGGQTGLGAFAGEESDGPAGAAAADGRTVGAVSAELDDLAAASGSGSQDRKLDLLFGLFGDCSPEEARYLARLVLGDMRIGVGEGAVRDAVAEAFEVPVQAVARALQVTNDYGLVAERARETGADGLEDLTLEVGRPVQAMLAQAGTVTDALEAWDEAVVETKLDGARVQVHYGRDLARNGGDAGDAATGADDAATGTDDAATGTGDAATGTGDGSTADAADDQPEVRLFSRNMEDVTDPLPEVVEFVEETVRPPAILDGEADGETLPFQEILRRFRRKHDVEAAREDVGVELHLFDCLHAPAGVADEVKPVEGEAVEEADGTEAADETASGSGQAGLSAFATRKGTESAAGSDAADDGAAGSDSEPDPGDGAAVLDEHGGGVDLLDVPLRERREFLSAAVDAGVVDAVITDDPDSIVAQEQEALEAGHEGIMLKNPWSTYTPGKRGKDWLKRKPDVETLDLVVTGAEWGEGRRAELFGTFQCSARTDDGYAVVGNVATGVTDEELASLHELLEPHVESEAGQAVDLEPAVVFEVGYEEIQRSPTYDSEYALRFPRFVAVRDDIDPDDADSLERIERLAEAQ